MRWRWLRLGNHTQDAPLVVLPGHSYDLTIFITRHYNITHRLCWLCCQCCQCCAKGAYLVGGFFGKIAPISQRL
jgi:hypothetical protein